ncbi:MauE/DoxX family redox-associated membrane protein [Fictibacillus sp. Mic-4]|uniref:MauE/DoxX family redox-associated membrane protein n=1 Tax=Fictibacillus sp. Mic-4 TaxID=3132826 RepID=UPI003CEF110E
MEELTLFIRMVIGIIFFSSFISKITNLTEHSNVIKSYKILPNKFVMSFAFVEISLEFFSSLLVLLGYLQEIASSILILLLILYSLAISLNLFNGRTRISCGCKGVMGDHKLSWILVLRNLLIICLCYWLTQLKTKYLSLEFFFKHGHVIFDMHVFVIFLGSLCLLIGYINLNRLSNIGKALNNINTSLE